MIQESEVKELKFSEYPYTRPDIKDYSNSFLQILERFKNADSPDKQINSLEEINKLRDSFGTLAEIAAINYTLDTQSEQNVAEQDYFDTISPDVKDLESQFYDALLSARFKSHLENKFGSLLFQIADLSRKSFSPEIIEELKKENQLTSEYTKLIASAKLEFDGKELNLSELGPYEKSTNRETRKAASKAKYDFFSDNEAELDRIYDELVKVRHLIATKLGYKSFTEVGYIRMMRMDYNRDMVKGYRDAIQKYIVPLANRLREKQLDRLGYDKLYFYDESIDFLDGNPSPKGSPEWIVENGRKMYSELSPETDHFFRYMERNELMDLVTRKGKAGGGYCTYLSNYKSPYIFSNFNGTSDDIDVLTHEAGHAFQGFSSRDMAVPEYVWPTHEACEIHSMSMEFLTWPWMELFFGDEAEKYRFAHLARSMNFLPYGVAVDEFQHEIYDNPEYTPAERKALWKRIESKYLPNRDYDGHPYLESGAFWQRQAHIYNSPFYYIDYTLAQVCAFQFWIKAKKDSKLAWNDYLRLCKAGGSKSFLKLVELANLESPFDVNVIEKVTGEIASWLEENNPS